MSCARARNALAATVFATVAALGIVLPAAPAAAADEVSATVKQVTCNPDGTASVYWNLHNTFNGEARFDVLRSTQGTLKFTTPPKTYQGNVRYYVLDGGATMVVYVTLVMPSPSVSLETDFYWPTGPEAGFSVTGNPPVQPPATCPKATTTATPRTRAPTSRPASTPASTGPTTTSPPDPSTVPSTTPSGAYEGISSVSHAPQAAEDRSTTRNTLIAVTVAMATLAMLSGGASLLVVRRRRKR